MSAVVHGLIGGAIAALITAYMASRVAFRGESGILRFGPFMWCLGFACLAFAAFPIVITLGFGHEKDFLAKVALFAAFLSGGVYCIGEAAFVTGRFDEKGIEFRTPWTGAKKGLWRDLVAVRFNDVAGWYTLTFRDGKKICLSRFLHGHGLALEAAKFSGEF